MGVSFLLSLLALIALVIAEDDMILKINNAPNIWKAGHNVKSIEGLSAFKKLLGTKMPKHGEQLLRRKMRFHVSKNIPKSFDSRTEWPKCDSILSIKDQGSCGSCWAVSVASAASDRLCIASNFKTQVNISAEDLMTCCSTCVDEDGCSGGYPPKAWTYLQHKGLVTGGDYDSNEGCQPYKIPPNTNQETNIQTPRCSKNCVDKNFALSYKEDKHYSTKSYYLPNDIAAIQTDILKHGPVQAAFHVYSDFMYYTSGIYTQSSPDFLGGHAVRVLGWGEENGVKYWLIANSWGRSWGENGTFRIKRGSNECEIETYMTAGLISS